MTDEPKPLDEEETKAFLDYLDRVGPAWLEKKIPDLLKKLQPTAAAPSSDLATFLQRELELSRSSEAATKKALEEVMDLIPDEIRATLRTLRQSQKKEVEADPSLLPKKKLNENLNDPPADPPKKKRSWL